MSVSTQSQQTKYRHDYQPSPYTIENTDLTFDLDSKETIVTSVLSIYRNPESNDDSTSLQLDGEDLQLLEILIDGKTLEKEKYEVTHEKLVIHDLSERCVLTTRCAINPSANTSLEGLYLSGGKFCTQCEAEGFRKITYYLDRPDVLSEFTVTVRADKTQYPFLLSNGNKIESGDLDNNRHFTKWHDPFKKPSYLFALVAADLDLLEDSFVTKSGRSIDLQLYVDKGKLDQSHFAMKSLKKAMKWDEDRFGLEYDLDLYMIVAVGDFNMGAMENKGLNIFNTKYVLANSQTATDQDFENIESVIGHEYFHNWTGNRVTCRDWFQLSLKEGLTVFRDQLFTEDMRSKAVKRIDDVKVIRSYQFAEDAGPMAHPIRPESYIEMNNFYTVTVYNKGAEVIRMLHTLLGEEGFQKGMRLYFERHDGSAATCDNFVDAMADANQVDLSKFRVWYSQAGTPTLEVSMEQDLDKQSVRFNFTQANRHESAKQPFVIPIKLGLINQQGDEVEFAIGEGLSSKEQVIIVEKSNQSITIDKIAERVVPSYLRDFSAPVKINKSLSLDELGFLFAHESNAFNRWDAGQELMTRYLVAADVEALDKILNGFHNILSEKELDPAFKARALTIPDLKTLFESGNIGIDVLTEARKKFKLRVAKTFQNDWQDVYKSLHKKADSSLEPARTGERAFKNIALEYLACCDEKVDSIVKKQFSNAQLMTEEISALSIACHHQLDCSYELVSQFYEKWSDEALVMDKWLSIQASVDRDDIVKVIKALRSSSVFNIKNPNKVRSIYASFAALNFAQFHRIDGAGYQLLVSVIAELNSLNPQIAANLAKQFNMVARLDDVRKQIIKDKLSDLITDVKLSNDVYEVVSMTLKQIEKS